jgi:hypothetical protein
MSRVTFEGVAEFLWVAMIIALYPDVLFFSNLMLVMSLRESLCMSFNWTLTVAHGQRSNFTVFLPVSGLTASASCATSQPMFLSQEAL